jgi:oligosaccharide repeat unit polymerase
VSTLGFQYRISPYVDLAFFISILGYLSIWVGRYVLDLTRGNFPLILLFQLTSPISQVVENNIKSKRAYLFIAFTALILGLIILTIQFREGCFFNARSLFLKHPLLRPLFNLTVAIVSFSFSFLSLRYIQFQEKRCLKFISLLLLIALFFGMRALALSGLLFLFMQWVFYREGKCSLFKLLGLCFSLFFVASVLGNFREGNFNLLHTFSTLLFKFFYGNNFSDTRDFAWILAFWDEEYLYGKTYLAALISFIPRTFSALREEWSISMYTNALMGFDSDVMPGLRPGLFGEAFLNFSYPGVIIYGLLLGFSLRYADLKVKEHVTKSKDIIKGYSCFFVYFLISHMSISANFWAVYVFLFLNFATVLIRGRVLRPC